MKTYGYIRKAANSQGLKEMSEVTFTGTASTIRKIAHFLLKAADEMDQHGDQFGHEHISDSESSWQGQWPDIIVSHEGKH